jgi:hypothetical protein
MSADLSSEIEKLPSKKSFKSGAYKQYGDEMIITDTSYLLWVIMDLIKIFGSINKLNLYYLLTEIFDIKKISIKNQSGNEIGDQETIKSIIDFLITILIKFNLIINNCNNCRVNFQYLNDNQIRLDTFSSVLFKEPFLKTKEAIVMRAKVINKAKKEGLIIWG